MTKKIPNKIKVEGAVPDNTKVRIINKLLSDEMPASDLKKQMDAYFAIPNPQMINDFRSMRVQGGDDACLRGALRNYVKTSMHPSLAKRVNLNEVYTGSISDTKKDVIDKIHKFFNTGSVVYIKPRQKHHLDSWRWRARGKSAVNIYFKIYNFVGGHCDIFRNIHNAFYFIAIYF